MNKQNTSDVEKENTFDNIHFADLSLDHKIIENKTFDRCKFSSLSSIETTFRSCKFIECAFVHSNLSASVMTNTSFIETEFEECKLIGINWTQAKWPLVKLRSPFSFYKSDISQSSFFGLNMNSIIIEECKAHDVDFREADLSDGRFVLTDLEKSLFLHSNLYSADFTEAINYFIDPNENDIRKAQFSMPDAMNLLRAFDIVIDE